VIILDNGRTNALADRAARMALFCIRCGACLNACPVYRRTGGWAYGWVYPGPIGAVLTPHLVGIDQAGKLPFASSLCGACGEVCRSRSTFHTSWCICATGPSTSRRRCSRGRNA